MTEFERVRYTAEVLEQAYNAVQSHDNCWNKDMVDGEYKTVCKDRQEYHNICLDIMKQIEELL